MGHCCKRGWNIKQIMFHNMFTRLAQEVSQGEGVKAAAAGDCGAMAGRRIRSKVQRQAEQNYTDTNREKWLVVFVLVR